MLVLFSNSLVKLILRTFGHQTTVEVDLSGTNIVQILTPAVSLIILSIATKLMSCYKIP